MERERERGQPDKTRADAFASERLVNGKHGDITAEVIAVLLQLAHLPI